MARINKSLDRNTGPEFWRMLRRSSSETTMLTSSGDLGQVQEDREHQEKLTMIVRGEQATSTWKTKEYVHCCLCSSAQNEKSLATLHKHEKAALPDRVCDKYN